MKIFGQRLKELRESKELSQEALGTLFHVSRTAIHSWEKDKQEPSLEVLKKLANFFDVSVDFLIDNTDEWGNMTDIQKSPAELPADKKELLTVYDSLSPARKQDVLTFVKSFASADASKK